MSKSITPEQLYKLEKLKPLFTQEHFIPQYRSGAKTQTRRPVKVGGKAMAFAFVDKSIGLIHVVREDFEEFHIEPKHQPGDIVALKSRAENFCGVPYFTGDIVKITDVRVEWLQDISEDDAIAEGVSKHSTKHIYKTTTFFTMWHYAKFTYYKDAFCVTIWNRLPYKPPYDWNSNPLVFVYEFEIVGAEKRGNNA